jgi:hypothetical protein
VPDFDLSFLTQFAQDALAAHGWERLALWATAALVVCRYLWRPASWAAGKSWGAVSYPFREPPEDPLVAEVVRAVAAAGDGDWDGATRELQVGNAHLVLATGWGQKPPCPSDLIACRVGDLDVKALLDEGGRRKVAFAACEAVRAIEKAREGEKRKAVIERLKGQPAVPILAQQPHPLRKKGA